MKNHEIQNLRAIAMFAVLIGHMPIVLPGILLHGYSFVSLFFAISGYLAVVSFNKKYPNNSTPIHKIITNEFANRALRLFPLMLIWILIYFFVGNMIIHMGGQYGDMIRWTSEIKAAATLRYNYYLAGLDIGGLFGQYWSLFVEIHFFVLFVFLFVFVRNKRARIIISAGSVLLTMLVLRPHTPVKLIRYVTHAHLDSLFAGVLVGLCCENKVYIGKRLPLWLKRAIGILLCVLLFLVAYVFDNYYNNPNVKYFVYTAISTVILFLAREQSGWFNYRGIIDKVMTWCGDVSASVYVSHVLLYSCIYYNIYYNTTWIPEVVKTTKAGIALQVIFLLVSACLVGKVSYHFIEVPYGLLAKKYLNKRNEKTGTLSK